MTPAKASLMRSRSFPTAWSKSVIGTGGPGSMLRIGARTPKLHLDIACGPQFVVQAAAVIAFGVPIRAFILRK
jgi:hypothetical protein